MNTILKLFNSLVIVFLLSIILNSSTTLGINYYHIKQFPITSSSCSYSTFDRYSSYPENYCFPVTPEGYYIKVTSSGLYQYTDVTCSQVGTLVYPAVNSSCVQVGNYYVQTNIMNIPLFFPREGWLYYEKKTTSASGCATKGAAYNSRTIIRANTCVAAEDFNSQYNFMGYSDSSSVSYIGVNRQSCTDPSNEFLTDCYNNNNFVYSSLIPAYAVNIMNIGVTSITLQYSYPYGIFYPLYINIGDTTISTTCQPSAINPNCTLSGLTPGKLYSWIRAGLQTNPYTYPFGSSTSNFILSNIQLLNTPTFQVINYTSTSTTAVINYNITCEAGPVVPTINHTDCTPYTTYATCTNLTPESTTTLSITFVCSDTSSGGNVDVVTTQGLQAPTVNSKYINSVSFNLSYSTVGGVAGASKFTLYLDGNDLEVDPTLPSSIVNVPGPGTYQVEVEAYNDGINNSTIISVVVYEDLIITVEKVVTGSHSVVLNALVSGNETTQLLYTYLVNGEVTRPACNLTTISECTVDDLDSDTDYEIQVMVSTPNRSNSSETIVITTYDDVIIEQLSAIQLTGDAFIVSYQVSGGAPNVQRNYTIKVNGTNTDVCNPTHNDTTCSVPLGDNPYGNQTIQLHVQAIDSVTRETIYLSTFKAPTIADIFGTVPSNDTLSITWKCLGGDPNNVGFYAVSVDLTGGNDYIKIPECDEINVEMCNINISTIALGQVVSIKIETFGYSTFLSQAEYSTYNTTPCAVPDCSGHGVCSNAVCVCKDRWSGDSCSNPPPTNNNSSSSSDSSDDTVSFATHNYQQYVSLYLCVLVLLLSILF